MNRQKITKRQTNKNRRLINTMNRSGVCVCVWCDCDKCASRISLLSFHRKEKRKIWCKQAIFIIGVLLISFVFSKLRQHSTHKHRPSNTTAQTIFLPSTFFPSSIFNKLLRSHNFAFQSFSFTSTWWFYSEMDKQNNWIHFWPIASQSLFLHSIWFIFASWIEVSVTELSECSAITKKSPHARWSLCACLFACCCFLQSNCPHKWFENLKINFVNKKN